MATPTQSQLPVQNDPALPEYCPQPSAVLPQLFTEFSGTFATIVKGELCAAEQRGQAYTDEVVRDLQATVDGINGIEGLNEKLAEAVKLFEAIDQNSDGKVLDDLSALRELSEQAAKSAASAATDATDAKQTAAEVLAELGELKSKYADALIAANERIDGLSEQVSEHSEAIAGLQTQVEQLPEPGVAEDLVRHMLCQQNADLVNALQVSFTQSLDSVRQIMLADCPNPHAADPAPQA